MKGYIFILQLCLFAMSCMNNNQNEKAEQEISESEVKPSESSEAQNAIFWELDVANDYPEKTINLEEIAEVRYVPLETTDQSLIQGIHKMATSDDKIITCDLEQNTIFIFDKDGHFINSINKQGPGPQDYSLIHNFAVDFQKRDEHQQGRRNPWVYAKDGI